MIGLPGCERSRGRGRGRRDAGPTGDLDGRPRRTVNESRGRERVRPLGAGEARRASPAFAVSQFVTALTLLALGCMRAAQGPPDPTRAAPGADSVTVALWRFDEPAGVQAGDDGPFRIHATAGPGTRVGYGRFAAAREFTRVIDSFVHVPYNPVFDSWTVTVEAWVFAHAFGQYEDTPIAARWTLEGNEQSWLFGIVGGRAQPPVAHLASPGYHERLVANGVAGQLVFAFQPAEAGEPRGFTSTRRIPLERWTHVAASFDGGVVRLFIDGRLDAQYATLGRIQPSRAPILVGNFFDPRRLTGFSGELRMETGGDDNPYYAFEGLIDELRISNAARTEFPETR